MAECHVYTISFTEKELAEVNSVTALRYVVVNNWEATYFNFNADKIVSIAEKAAEIGADVMVLDDGSFSKEIEQYILSVIGMKTKKKKLPEGL